MFTVYAADTEGCEDSHEMLPTLDAAMTLIQQMLDEDDKAVTRSPHLGRMYVRYGLSFDHEGAKTLVKRTGQQK